MVVGSRPTMQVVPSTVQFRAKPTETAAAQNVQVQNIGFANLAWTAAVRAPAPSWLSLTNATGGNDDSFTLNVNRQGLAVGTYMAYIDVTDPNATNSPQSVLVVLQALPETVIATHSFTSSATLGTHPGTVTASNASVTANLSSLPTGTQVYRAILVPNGVGCYAASQEGTNRSTLPLKVESLDAPGVWLNTVAPRHKTLDCHGRRPARHAGWRQDPSHPHRLAAERPTHRFAGPRGCHVRRAHQHEYPAGHRPAGHAPQRRHHADLPGSRTALHQFDHHRPAVRRTPTPRINATNEIRYRIYRSNQPIDAQTIRDGRTGR